MTVNDDRLAQLLDLAIDTRDRVSELTGRVAVLEAIEARTMRASAKTARKWSALGAFVGGLLSAAVSLGTTQCEAKKPAVPAISVPAAAPSR